MPRRLGYQCIHAISNGPKGQNILWTRFTLYLPVFKAQQYWSIFWRWKGPGKLSSAFSAPFPCGSWIYCDYKCFRYHTAGTTFLPECSIHTICKFTQHPLLNGLLSLFFVTSCVLHISYLYYLNRLSPDIGASSFYYYFCEILSAITIDFTAKISF